VCLRTTSREDAGDDENDDDIKKAKAMGKFKQWQTMDGINSFAMYISTLHDTHVGLLQTSKSSYNSGHFTSTIKTGEILTWFARPTPLDGFRRLTNGPI
jgi:hypothetical protein